MLRTHNLISILNPLFNFAYKGEEFSEIYEPYVADKYSIYGKVNTKKKIETVDDFSRPQDNLDLIEKEQVSG